MSRTFGIGLALSLAACGHSALRSPSDSCVLELTGDETLTHTSNATPDANGGKFILSCSQGPIGLTLAYQDDDHPPTPPRPGRYAITAKPRAGAAWILLNVDAKRVYQPISDGTLELTRWDANRVTGSFHVDVERAYLRPGEAPGGHMSVSGRFDFRCPDGKGCAR